MKRLIPYQSYVPQVCALNVSQSQDDKRIWEQICGFADCALVENPVESVNNSMNIAENIQSYRTYQHF